jgi:peptidoglycan/LPS O-acetylase OafA/YrhL
VTEMFEQRNSVELAAVQTISHTHDQVTSAGHAGRRIVALDGLRGVAAIMVLLHHALLMLPQFANYEWYGSVPAHISFGEFLLLRTPLRLIWAGQERAIMFFVLSGFVLCLPWLSGKPQSYGGFLLGRFCRIYPPYIAAMALAALASVFIGGHVLPKASIYFNQLGWAHHLDAGTLPSILLVLTNHHSDYINEAVWSLTWEVRVAILFPLLMLPILRWRNMGAAQVYLSLFLLGQAGWHLLRAHPDFAQLLGNGFRYTGCFVLGTVIAMNRVKIGEWFGRHHSAFGWLCLALGLGICWAPWPHFRDDIVGIGAALLIVAIIGTVSLRKWLAKDHWLWLGRQSYSLYLIHVPVVMGTVILYGGKVPPLACLSVIPVSIVLAQIFHLHVELPSVVLAQKAASYQRKRIMVAVTSLQPPSTRISS